MLVLSRKPGERILVGDDVQITVVRIGPNTVRLGIDAPREISIVRQELIINGEEEGSKETAAQVSSKEESREAVSRSDRGECSGGMEGEAAEAA